MMNRFPRKTMLLMAILALPFLSGCDKAKTLGGKLSSAADAVSSQSETEKFNAYIEAFNTLIDDRGGLKTCRDEYVEKDIPSAAVDASIDFRCEPDSLAAVIDQLKKGRAASADTGAKADATIDALLPALQRLDEQWKTLGPYYTGKSYRNDQLAKGKAADAALKADYDAALKALDSLDVALSEYQNAQVLDTMAAMKAEGNMVRYHAADVMRLSDAMIKAAQKEKFDAANKLAAELELAGNALRSVAGGVQPTDPNYTCATLMEGKPAMILGEYRDYAKDKDESGFNSLVSAYNSAVDAYGDCGG